MGDTAVFHFKVRAGDPWPVVRRVTIVQHLESVSAVTAVDVLCHVWWCERTLSKETAFARI